MPIERMERAARSPPTYGRRKHGQGKQLAEERQEEPEAEAGQDQAGCQEVAVGCGEPAREHLGDSARRPPAVAHRPSAGYHTTPLGGIGLESGKPAAATARHPSHRFARLTCKPLRRRQPPRRPAKPCEISKRRARDSNPQPLSGHLISSPVSRPGKPERQANPRAVYTRMYTRARSMPTSRLWSRHGRACRLSCGPASSRC